MGHPPRRNAALLFWALAALAAIAPRAEARETARRLADYRPVFLECHGPAGEKRLAIRRMRLDGEAVALTVDPATLETSLEAESVWRCRETTEAEQKDTRFLRALRPRTGDPDEPRLAAAGRSLSISAGLGHGAGAGSFLTGDLCPSQRPLDRDFLRRLAELAPGAPVALSVSGLWIERHGADFDWLMDEAASGTLRIDWVGHSYSHPYVPRLADGQNYLLRPGVDLDAEIFRVERLLIERGATPSAFFRFPGLVADARLMEELRRRHLIALGADAWLVLSPPPRDGSIVLVHPNGNEPAGLRLFSRLLEQGRLPQPFRRIEEAPE
ncbi:polysaccharide deacetylase [Methylosinus sp. LW3]|uniref:polysaccharide deacetylase family protein n=1 Tax=Methylosinus sp. LW3 TaxID=107635 RepID=UPI0004656835|nr:polysaccharide deacetylase [Methylosinus sp. LW3]